jgi:protein SCO1/2
METGKMHTIPGFSFRDQAGKLRTEKSVQGKVYVASFFFATCPGVCPRLTRGVSQVYKRFAQDYRVLFLSHTVTPEEDTQVKLAEFGKKYGIDPRRWYLLRGDQKRRIRGIYRGTLAPDLDRLAEDIETLLKERD